mgnify:CR=1 FL=1
MTHRLVTAYREGRKAFPETVVNPYAGLGARTVARMWRLGWQRAPTTAAGSPAQQSASLGWLPRSMNSWTSRLEALLARERRVILGITGSPGAGKTALASQIASSSSDDIDGVRADVGEDGFANASSAVTLLMTDALLGCP